MVLVAAAKAKEAWGRVGKVKGWAAAAVELASAKVAAEMVVEAVARKRVVAVKGSAAAALELVGAEKAVEARAI